MSKFVIMETARSIVSEIEADKKLVVCEAPTGCGKTTALCLALMELIQRSPASRETCLALVLCANNDMAYFVYSKLYHLCSTASVRITGTLVLPKHWTVGSFEKLTNANIVVAPISLISLFDRTTPDLSSLRFLALTDCFRSVSSWQEHKRAFKNFAPTNFGGLVALTSKLNGLSRDMCQSICELMTRTDAPVRAKVYTILKN